MVHSLLTVFAIKPFGNSEVLLTEYMVELLFSLEFGLYNIISF